MAKYLQAYCTALKKGIYVGCCAVRGGSLVERIEFALEGGRVERPRRERLRRGVRVRPRRLSEYESSRVDFVMKAVKAAFKGAVTAVVGAVGTILLLQRKVKKQKQEIERLKQENERLKDALEYALMRIDQLEDQIIEADGIPTRPQRNNNDDQKKEHTREASEETGISEDLFAGFVNRPTPI